MLTTTTVADCSLKGKPIKISDWPALSSAQLSRIVGCQAPGGDTEDAKNYIWEFVILPTKTLRLSNEDGEEPEGGWKRAYKDHARDDAIRIADGSPEYAGRQEWLREWSRNTAIYPLFVVREDDAYRLWDGYHRLAGAFHHGVKEVAVLLGTPKKKNPK